MPSQYRSTARVICACSEPVTVIAHSSPVGIGADATDTGQRDQRPRGAHAAAQRPRAGAGPGQPKIEGRMIPILAPRSPEEAVARYRRLGHRPGARAHARTGRTARVREGEAQRSGWVSVLPNAGAERAGRGKN